MDFTDCTLDAVKVGMPVEVSFRRKYADRQRGITGITGRPFRKSNKIKETCICERNQRRSRDHRMGCTKFGELWNKTAEDLIVEAFMEALTDAGS